MINISLSEKKAARCRFFSLRLAELWKIMKDHCCGAGAFISLSFLSKLCKCVTFWKEYKISHFYLPVSFSDNISTFWETFSTKSWLLKSNKKKSGTLYFEEKSGFSFNFSSFPSNFRKCWWMRDFKKKIPNNPQSELVFQALKHIFSYIHTLRVHKTELRSTRAVSTAGNDLPNKRVHIIVLGCVLGTR